MNIQKLFFNLFLKKNNSISADISTWPEEWKTIFYKSYRRSKKVTFLEEDLAPQITKSTLNQLLEERKSGTNFKKGIHLKEFFTLCTIASCQKKDSTSRPYPSAGGLYPLELYYINNDTSDMLFDTGLYHFSQVKKELSLVKKIAIQSLSKSIGSVQPWVENASGIIIVTYTRERNMDKYEWFGVRSAYIETGALLQTISLVGATLEIQSRHLGYTNNEVLDALLEIDSYSELSIAVMAIGK